MDIDVSVVMPCLNEEKSIGACIEKTLKAFNDFRLNGEIIVSDNGSTDRSIEIASSFGERVKVVHQPEKGYGSAYLKGLDSAKGRFIVIGDSDSSYDFYDIPHLLRPLKEEGIDMVIGSRFKGEIAKGAMPWANRYIGNPVLSGMLRILFRTDISDSHSGFRAFTKEAYKKMRLCSTGMEFASEIIVSALKNHLKIKEIPIKYHPRKGLSKLNPLKDAWRHIRFMFMYSPDYLYLVPGLFLFFTGLVFQALIFYFNSIYIGPFNLELHSMIFFNVFTLLGFQILLLGLYTKSYFYVSRFERPVGLSKTAFYRFKLEHGLLVGGLLFLIGVFIMACIFFEWGRTGFGGMWRLKLAILSTNFTIVGIQIIFSSFFLSMLKIEHLNKKLPE
jgi:glycosyltransferase involved in cell wall biosynthesis